MRSPADAGGRARWYSHTHDNSAPTTPTTTSPGWFRTPPHPALQGQLCTVRFVTGVVGYILALHLGTRAGTQLSPSAPGGRGATLSAGAVPQGWRPLPQLGFRLNSAGRGAGQGRGP